LDIALLQKNFETAKTLADQLVRDYPDDPIVKLKVAIFLIKENRLTEAEAILQEDDTSASEVEVTGELSEGCA
jgi:predicted Zn-dependent protease